MFQPKKQTPVALAPPQPFQFPMDYLLRAASTLRGIWALGELRTASEGGHSSSCRLTRADRNSCAALLGPFSAVAAAATAAGGLLGADVAFDLLEPQFRGSPTGSIGRSATEGAGISSRAPRTRAVGRRAPRPQGLNVFGGLHVKGRQLLVVAQPNVWRSRR